MGAAAIFLDQQCGACILKRHHHHRAVARPGADQAFIGAFGAVAEAQLHLLDGEQPALGDNAGIENLWLLRHAGSVINGWSAIIAAHFSKTQPLMLNWNTIDTVLLDMDGTLLD